MRDYYPLGVSPEGHISGLDCPCQPYEAECETVWRKNRDEERIGMIVKVVVRHRPLVPPRRKVGNVRWADLGDGLPPGARDLVTTMQQAENRCQQRVAGGQYFDE